MDHPTLDDVPFDQEFECSPGVVVERRSILVLAAGLVGVAAKPVLRAASLGTTISFEEFLAIANPLATELVGDTTREGQDRYLLALAAIAVRLSDVAVPEMKENSAGRALKTFIGANDGGDPFNVLHWRMEPGAIIGTHPHIYGNVVTLVLDGDVRIQNYEQVGERDFDAKGTFRVRKSCDQIVSRGGTNLVSLERNYMHGFKAGPSGARGLDITTRIREKRPSPTLDVAKTPVDEALSIYEASWR